MKNILKAMRFRVLNDGTPGPDFFSFPVPLPINNKQNQPVREHVLKCRDLKAKIFSTIYADP